MVQVIFLFISMAFSLPAGTYLAQGGTVRIKSDAPLELIEATSKELKGALNLTERTFAFTVDIQSFQGFNSPLQREHFNENYLESRQHKAAMFVGKLIEDDDLSKDGEYSIRAKGKFTVHGVEKERIIKSTVKTKNGRISVVSDFTVLLDDHNIAIPKVVHQKIAEEIQVHVEAEFIKK